MWCWGGGGGGVSTPGKINGGYAARFKNPLPYWWPKSANFPILFITRPKSRYPTMAIAAGSVDLNVIYDDLLLMVLEIMMKK